MTAEFASRRFIESEAVIKGTHRNSLISTANFTECKHGAWSKFAEKIKADLSKQGISFRGLCALS